MLYPDLSLLTMVIHLTPGAVAKFGSCHEVVNHTVGFVNAQGAHTNQIGSLWSHLKHAYRKRGGINKGRMNFFLNEWK